MKLKLILILILALPLYLSFAQERADLPVKQNSISVTIGHNQFKDENLHPKAFRGLVIGSSYLHSRISKNISEYSAGFKISLLNTSYEDFPATVNILILGNYRFQLSSQKSLNTILVL